MLVEFSVGNYKSIKERQTLSLAAQKSDSHNFTTHHKKAPYLLKRVAILGPNASGKSNILEAIQVALRIIKTSFKYELDEKIPVEPYLLNEETAHQPSEFEFVFIHDGTLYQYGFTADTIRIHTEWLYASPQQGKLQRWIDRGGPDEDKATTWYINPSVIKGRRAEWIQETRPNTLLLSLIGTLKNHPIIKLLQRSLAEKIRILPSKLPHIFTSEACLGNESIKNKVSEFLQMADLGIVDINIEEKPFSPSQLPNDLPEEVKKDLCTHLADSKQFTAITVHNKEGGGKISFDMNKESDGTALLYAWAFPLIDTLASGSTLIIDEINRSMHFKELEFIENLFSNLSTNPNGAQLIFTTHDISVLHRFHREEIYFTDKQDGFHTQLYPLTDFENRGDISIYNRYTSGVYCALPNVKMEP